VEGFEETFRSTAFIGELAGCLFPRPVNFSHHVVVGNKGVVEHYLVEIMLPGHLIDRIDRDTRCVHVHQKLRETMAAIILGWWRCPKESEHVVGNVRVASPDL